MLDTQTFARDLFESPELVAPASRPSRNPQLDQWFTPAWAAEDIVEQAFGWLQPGMEVLEPTCGNGAFLCALPAHVNAVGCEIDPSQAAAAAAASGRHVSVGDVLQLPDAALAPSGHLHALVGNPPFKSEFIAALLRRAHTLLVDGGQAGLLLPAYALQSSSTVEKLHQQYSIQQSLLPRNLFPRLRLPLVFATFTKERHRRLVGFMLYREAQEIRSIAKHLQETAVEGRESRGVWYAVVRDVLNALGGSATLDQIYAHIEPRRPTANRHWHAKVRQVVQHPRRFRRVGAGHYALAS